MQIDERQGRDDGAGFRGYRNVRLVTLPEAGGLGIVDDGALLCRDGRIVFAGRQAELPASPASDAGHWVDGGGRYLYPVSIDCHTHLVFGGHRADEFELKLAGASYAELAARGMGIRSTVRATRALGEEELLAQAMPRLERLAAEGVGVVEIKSGYGLALEHERKMLRVARRLGEALGIRVVTTFLGLHALPEEWAHDRAGYVRAVCDQWLPALSAEGLVDQVDAYCEGIGFTTAEVARCFEAARRLGLPVKAHAEQLSLSGGASLVAAHAGLSADHVEYVDEAAATAMAAAGTVAVLLPGAYYVLRETVKPPVAAFRRHGVPMAVATDLNPGTSPLRSLKLAMHLACTCFGLDVAEAWRGVTRHAARALGLSDQYGSLTVGKRAAVVLRAESPAEYIYWLG